MGASCYCEVYVNNSFEHYLDRDLILSLISINRFSAMIRANVNEVLVFGGS